MPEALRSVYSQDYSNIEIILIDDGSTDDTKTIAEKHKRINYFYQNNQGLSSARNAGIKRCKGEFLVFLDADDWLLPKAISTNIFYLIRHKNLAFVSGAHQKVFIENSKIENVIQEIKSDHYYHLLQSNYIGMHATVMFRRWIFDEFLFDTVLNACEDYDIYLRIARKYPVAHHNLKIASYRIHNSNMSGNPRLMLNSALKVLNRQKINLLDKTERKALKVGKRNWKEYYYPKIYQEVSKLNDVEKSMFSKMGKYYISAYSKYFIEMSKISMNIKSAIKRNAPKFILSGLHKIGLYENFSPSSGEINFGDFNRSKPFNSDFGYSRGGPVDRYYIENFLESQSGNIKGRVLEVADNEYTLRFGGTNVLKSDILHINEQNPKATVVGDLSNAPHLPGDSFDCIILTQTLHLIYDFKGAIKTCYRVLKPGGALLITVPGISQIDHNEWKDYWYWSFTDKSVRRMLLETFPEENVIVESYGNVLAATAFLYGVGLPELNKEQLDFNDPHYQVTITAVAVKPE